MSFKVSAISEDVIWLVCNLLNIFLRIHLGLIWMCENFFCCGALGGFKKRFSKASTNWISDIHFMLCKYVNHFPFTVACLLGDALSSYSFYPSLMSCSLSSLFDMLWMVMESSSRIRWMNEKMKKSFEIWRHAWPFPIQSSHFFFSSFQMT